MIFTIILVSSVCFIFTLIFGIYHRIVLFYREENVRAIEWFYPWTIEAIKYFNKEIKYRHWLTTFLCTIVGIIDTIITIPAFILILLWEAIRCTFKLIIKGIKSLIFVNPKEKEEETNDSIEKNLAFSYRTEAGTVNIYYDPKTHVRFYSLKKE